MYYDDAMPWWHSAFFPLMFVAIATVGIFTAPARPELTVSPRNIIAGQALRLTCKVPRDASNRRVAYGMTLVGSSERQMEGEASRVTYEMLIEHVPCEPGEAFCEVWRTGGGRPVRVSREVTTVGCDQ